MLNKVLVFFLIVSGLISVNCSNEPKEKPEPKESSKTITEFGFPKYAATGTINKTDKTIEVLVSAGTNLKALAPAISHTGAGISPQSGSVRNFTKPVTYTVTAADGSTRDYTITVKDGLPAVTTAFIAADTAAPPNLNFSKDIAGTSAKGGGNVFNQGSSAVTERGLCWNTTGKPALTDPNAAESKDTSSYGAAGSGVGRFTYSMTGLTQNQIYYVRAYAVNSLGTSYGNQVQFNSGQAIGSQKFDGYVFYNNGNGHGLICARVDQSLGAPWWNHGSKNARIGGTGTAVGTGMQNTIEIVNACKNTKGNYAARVCDNYNGGDYSEWFLPSIDELELMYIKLHKTSPVYAFFNFEYWSSSEYNENSSHYILFSNGIKKQAPKTETFYARAVRTF